MLVPGSLRTAKQVREGRAALISKTAGLKAAWNTETETKIANLRTKPWTCCLTHNWLEMNAEQSRTLARWCNLLCFLHLFPYAQSWLIAVATMFLKLKSLTKKKKKIYIYIYIQTYIYTLDRIYSLGKRLYSTDTLIEILSRKTKSNRNITLSLLCQCSCNSEKMKKKKKKGWLFFLYVFPDAELTHRTQNTDLWSCHRSLEVSCQVRIPQ